MKGPAISTFERRPDSGPRARRGDRGVTILLVAAALVAIMAMAALSIDVVTLYLANAEAQRSADAAALAAARVLSMSGMTGDPANNPTGNGFNAWQQACQLASQVATTVAQQEVGGTPPTTVNVTFPNDPSGNCTDGAPASTVFAVNPMVQVQVQRNNLPTFFARIWGHRGTNVSAIATAEAYNPSNSATYAGSMVPVQPRCVKPWIIPNLEPGATTLVSPIDGSITNAGISGTNVIGKTFVLSSACTNTGNCYNMEGAPLTPAGNYIPALVQAASVAVASGATSDLYQEAIGGCDQSTVYACGTPSGATADLTFNPGIAPKGNGDTSAATQVLINGTSGNDQINTTVSYPFQIRAGSNNPLFLAGIVNNNDVITSSNSIVTIPIMDNVPVGASNQPSVTIVGFLQGFVTTVDTNGNPGVTILNVSGCSNTATTAPVTGSSPVPVRLINYP